MHDPDLILDIEVLRKLEAIMPQERVMMLAGSFLRGLVARAGRIAALVESGNLHGLGREAHDLKSTSGSFGARRLQYLGEQLETACRETDVDGVHRHAAAVTATLPDTLAAVLHHYPQAQIASEADESE
jgi:HPt (histidine-containing phosphotransfer) domain-containing protein